MSISLSTLETYGMQSRGLVSTLEDTFPLHNASPEDSIEKIMYRAGQRNVVEFVIQYMEQNDV